MIKRKWISAIAIWGFLLMGCQNSSATGDLVGSITAVGSSALQPLVEVAAEMFQKQQSEVFVNVQGGGSGQGLSQIINGTVDIGNSDIFAEDKKINASKYAIKDNKVAVVGIGPIVNKHANVTNLSKEQLKQIFTGKLTNWSQVGGSNLPIIVINRANGSGSRATFEKFGLDGIEPITAQEQDNSGTVKKLVSETSGAISYVSFSYFNDALYTSLSIDNIAPTKENIETNKWTIWAYEHMYTSKEPNVVTEKFIEYMFSDTIQNEVIPKLGYIPVKNMKVDRDAKGNITFIQ